MELIRGIHNIRDRHRGCVLTIGNFDGVHLGHQEVLRRVVEKARELGLPSMVMLFEPQPRELFAGEKAPARLTRLRDKYVQLAKLGVERLVMVNFNAKFASITPHDFVHRLLAEQLGVKFLVVGDDFRFGAKRQGDFCYLQNEAKTVGFEVVSTDSFTVSEQRVSSTAIRNELAAGHQAEAESMLGRPYSISGRVSHGKKLGRTIGFPTANVPLKRRVSPVSGVYVVRVGGIEEEQWLGGVANVGTRPTVNGVRQQLEVHLFDLESDLYGLQIEVQLLHKLRDEMKFGSLDELKAQIGIDAQTARAWLAEHDEK